MSEFHLSGIYPGPQTADLLTSANFPQDIRITQISDEGPTPSFFIRFRDPIASLTRNWNYFQSDEPGDSLLDGSTILVAQRTLSIRTLSLLQYAKAKDIPIIYETDDLITDLPPQTVVKVPPDKKEAIHSALAMADLVTCSTPTLADKLAEYNKNVLLLANYAIPFPAASIRSVQQTTPHLAIVNTDYFKLISSKNDLIRALDSALKTLKYRITFFGTIDPFMEQLKGMYADNVDIVRSFIPWRRRFLEQLLLTHGINVAIVPLERNTHHRYKSDIKFLDFASIGVPGIFNNPAIYRRVVHEENGFLCDGTYRGWLDGLAYFADRGARTRCGEAAYVKAQERMLEHYASQMGSAIVGLVDRSRS